MPAYHNMYPMSVNIQLLQRTLHRERQRLTAVEWGDIKNAQDSVGRCHHIRIAAKKGNRIRPVQRQRIVSISFAGQLDSHVIKARPSPFLRRRWGNRGHGFGGELKIGVVGTPCLVVIHGYLIPSLRRAGRKQILRHSFDSLFEVTNLFISFSNLFLPRHLHACFNQG